MAATAHTKLYNMAKVNVSGAHDASTTTVSLDTGERAKLPTPIYKLLWWDATNYSDPWDDPKWEIVEVTAHPGVGDDLTVIRGSETAYGGQAGSTKNTGGADYVMANVLTAYNWERLRQRCAFRAHRNGSDQSIVTATTTKVLFNAEDFDVVSQNYDTTNSYFLAPRPMVMHISAAVQMSSLAGYTEDDSLWIYIYTGPSGSTTLHSYARIHAGGNSAAGLTAVISDLVNLSTSDVVEIYTRHSASGNRDVNGAASASWFCGFEVLPQ